MCFHFLSLSTFEPHPRAANPTLEWPVTLHRKKVSLGFQICDDGFFVLNHNSPGGPDDQVCGWQWTTGRLAVVSRDSSAVPTKAKADGDIDIAGGTDHVVRILHPH